MPCFLKTFALVCVLSVILTIALWAIFTFAFEKCCQSRHTHQLRLIDRLNKYCTNYLIGAIGNKLFGLQSSVGGGRVSGEEEGVGRIAHLENSIGRKVEEATAELRNEISELEKRLRGNE